MVHCRQLRTVEGFHERIGHLVFPVLQSLRLN